MTPLHKLPTGEWINLTSVIRISPMEGISNGATPFVFVQYGGNYSRVNFSYYPDAQDYADALAALVNAAHEETK